MNRIQIQWVEEENVGILCYCGEELMLNIYEYTECPKCGKAYKVKILVDVIERGENEIQNQ